MIPQGERNCDNGQRLLPNERLKHVKHSKPGCFDEYTRQNKYHAWLSVGAFKGLGRSGRPIDCQLSTWRQVFAYEEKFPWFYKGKSSEPGA